MRWEPWFRYAEKLEIPGVTCKRDWFDSIAPEGDPLRPLIGLCLSVAKWHPSNPRQGSRRFCGLCYAHMKTKESFIVDCGDCPLKLSGGSCIYDLNSMFRKWDRAYIENSARGQKKAADRMYRELCRLYVEEYFRVEHLVQATIWNG